VVADSAICSFALIADAQALPALDRFSLGGNEYPDRSATLILQVESLRQGPAFELRGPGIDGSAVQRATQQPADLYERLAINATLFPRGIDVVLVADDAVVAIPRTTRLVAKGD
jgi:alpha-D-ribose 1-methylphosphonate 5-triphosphate synthase subunit PhnH